MAVLIFIGQLLAIWLGVSLTAVGGFITGAGRNVGERDLIWAGVGIAVIGLVIFGAAIWGIVR